MRFAAAVFPADAALLFFVMAAAYAGIKGKSSVQQGSCCGVGSSRYAAVQSDTDLVERLPRTAADAAAVDASCRHASA